MRVTAPLASNVCGTPLVRRSIELKLTRAQKIRDAHQKKRSCVLERKRNSTSAASDVQIYPAPRGRE